MPTIAPPTSQKAGERPISFLLDGQKSQTFVDLVIRPEDLTRTDPSRISVQQTLGGAWADNFGAGLAQITLSGHTGWRRTQGDSDDGLERFTKLKTAVFDDWHKQRADLVKSGLDPAGAPLIFSDALDDFSVVVAPLSFVLRRSRSRPLLAQYQISMVVLDDAEFVIVPRKADAADGGILDKEKGKLGLASLSASVDRITSMINSVRNFVQSNLVGPVQAFMNQTAKLYASVRGALSAVSGVVSSVISVAQMVTQAGVNLFRTLAAIASIPQLVKSSLMAVASAYSNILCVLKNALKQPIHFSDYSDLYGSSNCSSTSGGRPVSSLGGVNPFYNMIPTGGPSPVSITPAAQSSVLALAHSDPVLAPPSMSAIQTHVNTIAGGLAVA